MRVSEIQDQKSGLERILEEKEREITVLKEEIRRLRERIKKDSISVEDMLKRRGMVIFKKEIRDDLLIPKDPPEEGFYDKMKKYSFRLFLRDLIRHQRGFSLKNLIHYTTEEVTAGYLDYCIKCGIVTVLENGKFSLSKIPVRSFGSTLEWFISKVLEKEYGASAIWGVRFKDTSQGGDYDLIANIEGKILYMEVKSSPPKQICDTEIKAFLDRIEELGADMSVFFMDTELRMKDKIVPMFDLELKKRYVLKRPEILRMERELFCIEDRIFILNSKDNIVTNIGTALNWYFRKRG
jgi:hypothetical protein